ncbi:hypothetical protein EK21DRAFT_93826 [Setomelanomma holmii]|uniref:Uncharacterized protein n=1 Tax=Setomelanomma holmii TaxID=210430 RepID=A0A9P4H0C1_9PLEO|nr:hypothetical protein EK21DRAFT_93826 [Setomelanomma holmii]
MEEPAVLNAMLTLSSAHKGGTLHQATAPRAQHSLDERFLLQHYSASINGLAPHLVGRNRYSLRVVLITCMLFILFGISSRKYSLRASSSSQWSIGPCVLSESVRLDRKHCCYAEAMVRLYVQRELFSQFQQPISLSFHHLTIPAQEPPRFLTYDLAWQHLERVFCRISELTSIGQPETLENAPSQPGCTRALEQAAIRAQLAQWLNVFEVSEPDLVAQEPSLRASNLLRGYHSMARIMAATCHSSPDMSRSIIDMGWLPPLYYTALKCRVRPIRWHAVRLLHCTFHKEGIWDSRICASVARAMVRLEEIDFHGEEDLCLGFALEDVPGPKQVSEPMLPQECRISQVKVDLPEGPSESVTVHFEQYGFWRTIESCPRCSSPLGGCLDGDLNHRRLPFEIIARIDWNSKHSNNTLDDDFLQSNSLFASC